MRPGSPAHRSPELMPRNTIKEARERRLAQFRAERGKRESILEAQILAVHILRAKPYITRRKALRLAYQVLED